MSETVMKNHQIKVIPKTEKIKKEVEENGDIMELLGYDHEKFLVRCEAFVGWIKNKDAEWEYYHPEIIELKSDNGILESEEYKQLTRGIP